MAWLQNGLYLSTALQGDATFGSVHLSVCAFASALHRAFISKGVQNGWTFKMAVELAVDLFKLLNQIWYCNTVGKNSPIYEVLPQKYMNVRIWAPFHAKVPIERAHLWYVESMSTSLDYIAT